MPYTDGSRKRIRSDQVTTLLLECIDEHVTDATVKAGIADIREHLARSRNRGGQRMLELAAFARREALAAGDTATADRLDDLVGHATGRILTDDVTRRYQLYEARQTNLDAVQLMVSNTNALGAYRAKEYLEHHPDATAAELVSHLQELGELSLRVVEDREHGHYRVLRLDTEAQVWLAEVLTRRLRTDFDPGSGRGGLDLTDAELTNRVEAAHLQLRRERLALIRDVVENPNSTEAHLQDAIRGSYWLFGGSYVGETARRRFTTGTEVDVPLLRPDGSLHVVELKRANTHLVRKYRAFGLIVDRGVHEAVSQVANYLTAFDEDRNAIRGRYGIESRRASGTVVIGHPGFQPQFGEQEIAETLRTYNAEHARISVITYKELLDNAERSLTFADNGD
ncbi:DUF4263 domain-containing protein [Amycolatopsis sp. H6(2020)]|nr:DUF4263 domain-containing protein [Amycolatopsis sp. H6(2020)]